MAELFSRFVNPSAPCGVSVGTRTVTFVPCWKESPDLRISLHSILITHPRPVARILLKILLTNLSTCFQSHVSSLNSEGIRLWDSLPPIAPFFPWTFQLSALYWLLVYMWHVHTIPFLRGTEASFEGVKLFSWVLLTWHLLSWLIHKFFLSPLLIFSFPDSFKCFVIVTGNFLYWVFPHWD